MEAIMRKSDKIEQKILDAALWGAAIWGGVALVAHIARSSKGVGKVERIKRRIYKEVSLAQDAGVDFSKKYPELSKAETDALSHIGKDIVQWKQSKRSVESGKPYVESYYNSLRRAWNAVSGIKGIGAAYNVKDANGNICLTWIEDAAAHVEAETIPVAPVVPEKKKKQSRSEAKNAERAERERYAQRYVQNYIMQHPDDEHYWTIDRVGEDNITRADYILNDFIDGKLKIKRTNDRWRSEYKIYFQGKWRESYGMNSKLWSFLFGLLNGWDMRGFDDPQLDEIRRAVLDRSEHMMVTTQESTGLGDWNKEFVKGADRYNYLPMINYVVVVSQRFANGESVYYPVRSYPDYDSASQFQRFKYSEHGKVVPIYEIDLDRISGL